MRTLLLLAILVGVGAAQNNPLIGQAFPDLAKLDWVTERPLITGARGMTIVRWWTTGCPHCKASLPALSALAAARPHVRLVSVFHPKGGTARTNDDLEAYMKSLGVRTHLARDDDWAVLRDLMQRGGLKRATSVSFLVDEWGRVRWVHPGPRIHPDAEGAHGSADADHEELAALLDSEAALAQTDFRVMSFNVRYGTAKDGDNVWDRRKGLVLRTIKRFDPDLLATQEMLPFQREWLTRRLPGHFTLGRGRQKGGAGEQCTLFFRMSRFAVLGSGTFWLSPTPDEEASRGWDAALPRIATWARLKDQATGKTLRFVSTHFDHRGPKARANSAALLRERLGALTKEEPLILAGDFNAREGSRPYQALLAGDSPFTDTFRVATPEGGVHGTFNGFRGQHDGRRIDWILSSPQWKVRGGAIDRYGEGGRWPSDHYPVTAVLSLR